MAEIKVLTNPRKRRKTTKKRKLTVSRKRRRNPIKKNQMVDQVKTGLMAGTGAVILDVGMGYIPIPEDLKAGAMSPLVKGAVAIGLGMVLDKTKIVKKATSKELVGGMLAVTAHSFLRAQVKNFAPDIPLGEYYEGGMGYTSSALPVGYDASLPIDYSDSMGEFFETDAMGEYTGGEEDLFQDTSDNW